jgi:hypothetical protein
MKHAMCNGLVVDKRNASIVSSYVLIIKRLKYNNHSKDDNINRSSSKYLLLRIEITIACWTIESYPFSHMSKSILLIQFSSRRDDIAIIS